MNFLAGFTQVKTIIGGFVGKRTDDSIKVSAAADQFSMFRSIVRYSVRLCLLLLILFIFIWWPVDDYNPEGFDVWSQRMTDLPGQVWALISTILLFWATGEIIAQRADNHATLMTQTASPMDDSLQEEGEDFMSLGEDLDGRFANLQEDNEEFFSAESAPNSVIEDWRNNAPR